MGGLLLTGGLLAGSLTPATASATVAVAPPAPASDARTAPAASKDVGIFEAPVGWQCGAYRSSSAWNAELRYNHCGGTKIRIEVDARDAPNWFMCVGPWQEVYVTNFRYASHAWYVEPC
ncbi:DUF6355 family natural product biosynthesis protein [Nonomuraea recticatena]